MLFKKDQTAALTYTCSPRVTLTHILLNTTAITIEMTSHLFSSSNLKAYGLKKKQSGKTNNVIPALCTSV